MKDPPAGVSIVKTLDYWILRTAPTPRIYTSGIPLCIYKGHLKLHTKPLETCSLLQ